MTTKSLHDVRAVAALMAMALLLFAAGACGPADDGHGHDGEAGHKEHGAHEGEGHDEHEGESGVVHLSEDQVERAGVRTQSAGPGTIDAILRLDAVVTENEDSQSHVNPRAAGIIREIHVGLGDTVARGDALCEIDSVELGEAVGSYLKARATASAARGLLAKERDLFAQRIETASRVLDGAIAVARRIRDREKELEGEGISTLRPLLEAERALQEAELTKEQALTDLQAERDTRILELESAAAAAAIEEHAEGDHLRVLGVDPRSVAHNEPQGERSLGLYSVKAPRAGVIVARDATPDEFVGSETTLFEIHDPAIAWVVASVYERDLRRVQKGQAARVTVNALPQAVFEGSVGFIAFDVSPETRAARVRIEIPNHPVEEWKEAFPLRPGMFGTVEIVTESRRVNLALPERALVHEGAATFVFVRTEPGEFVRRAVRVGLAGASDVEIVDGLDPGEEVALDGTFVLKSAARAGELGGGHSH